MDRVGCDHLVTHDCDPPQAQELIRAFNSAPLEDSLEAMVGLQAK
ncbi:MAG: hypothetical protein WBZ37_29505 [Mycobacterium sp.]